MEVNEIQVAIPEPEVNEILLEGEILTILTPPEN